MSEKLTFRCGHAKATNTQMAGGRARCRICHRAYQAEWTRRMRLNLPERVVPPVEVEDAAITLYRAEKAKRADKPNPRMLEAEAAFARLLDREAIARRGGRPKSIKNQSGQYAERRVG